MNLFIKIIFIWILLFTVFSPDLFAQFKNIQINNSSANQPNEVSIAINPKNPNFISAGSNLNLFYSSSDGGNTWTQKLMSSVWKVWGDPCLIYDTNGNLFFAHLSDQRNTGTGYWIDRIVVQRSTSNGSTWDYDVGVGFSPPSKQQDKEWLCADYSNSIYRNNLYLAWTEFDKYGSTNASDHSRILFSRSTNSGASWSNPIKISDNEGDCIDDDNTMEGAVPCTGPNGEVYLSWSGPFGIQFDKSTDGGVSFSNDIYVANLNAGWAFDIPGINRANGFPVTACDISNSPYRGNIYINWSDQINGDTDIFLSKSTDGGTTWSFPLKVNNDLLPRHQFFNWMTVDPVTGKIYIIFYDRRDNLDPNSTQTHVYIARSDDGGNSFMNIRISETPFFPLNTVFFGDYTNIAAYNGKIYPIWMRMDGNKMSVWNSVIDDSQLITSVNARTDHIPEVTNLFQNYPNPFNPVTTINFQVEKETYVNLKVYDIIGNEIATLVNEIKKPGSYNVSFDGGKFSSGIYLYRLVTPEHHISKKMIITK
jgi:hypothetical protein